MIAAKYLPHGLRARITLSVRKFVPAKLQSYRQTSISSYQVNKFFAVDEMKTEIY